MKHLESYELRELCIKAANNQNLVCYFRGVRNALAAVGIELGFNITNGEDFDK